jgi:hypothetical protein
MPGSYPQKLYTGAKTLWDTPNAMREVIKQLTHGIRFLREKRTAYAVSSLKRRKRGRVLPFWRSLRQQGYTTPIQLIIQKMKLYAHSRILDYKEFQCFKESLQRITLVIHCP